MVLTLSLSASAQNFELARYIIPTDTITDDERTFSASSDDAEQENDAIDDLFDDDIDAGWEGEPEDQNTLTAGMRFQNLTIPQGARIDSAFIVVSSHEAKTPEDVANLTIYGEATDDAQTFTDDALITDRPSTLATVEWTVAEEWGLYTFHRTADLTPIVQELVDREGWESGNSIAFIVAGEDQGPSEVENAREWEAVENIADPADGGDGQHHPERIPQLFVYYSVESALVDLRIAVTDTITDEERTFNASSDDAEQENDEIDDLFDDDIDAGWEGEPEDQNTLTAGMRFQNIPVPQGAVIDSAFIIVSSHEAKTAEDVANLTIYAEATDDAQTFTEDALITDRPSTAATVEWTVAEEWGLYTFHPTPDLSSIVQEVVDREGWESGNSIAFIVAGEDQGPSEVENAREWESVENIADPADGGDGQHHPERIPQLLIYFSSNSVGVNDIFVPGVEALRIFPNPANEQVTLEFQGSEAATIQLFDASGRQVRSLVSTFGQQVPVDISGLQAGMYYLRAEQAGVRYAQKLIVR